MSTVAENSSEAKFTFLSSVENEVWGGNTSGGAYEWWYFDALSDDASEAIVVVFLDNFVFSPRYNEMCRTANGAPREKAGKTFPAVVFVYYRDGKPLYRSICEFSASEIEGEKGLPGMRIGNSSFEYSEAPYGDGYVVKIDAPLPRGKRLRAAFEWLSIESNLLKKEAPLKPGHVWNMVAPRSDVTGRITILDRKGRREKIKFRGTGYHDNNSDTRWMPKTIDNWFWGRAHFPFATAVYYRYREISSKDEISKLFLVRDGGVEEFDAELVGEGGEARDKFGIKYPTEQRLRADGIDLTINSPRVIDSSFFYLRFLSRFNLKERGGETNTTGIAEILRPATLTNKWLARLTSFRIGKGGKSAFLP